MNIESEFKEMRAGAEKAAKAVGVIEGGKENKGKRLVDLVEAAGAYLFHDNGKVFVTLNNGETYPLSGNEFTRWLKAAYWKEYGIPATSQAFKDAMGVLQAKAQYEGKEHQVFSRIAFKNKKVFIYLELLTWQ